eukprot:TRINITY_DN44344_c0_g1_i1.p1 TRINITY_DN44344_c0_g1~~TRINITY_DN44344_c0_g1_i1.p1  ORF type:complete len:187 (+),score=29.85 TRINITY_DN44344_c0_g1_i1:466-1026(+)
MMRKVHRSVLPFGAGVFGAPPRRFKYSAKVEERYRAAMNPKNRDPNVGQLPKTDKDVYHSSVGSGACGDMLRFSVRISDEGRIEDVKYLVFGCGSAIASSSYAAEYLKGRSVEEAESLTNRDIARELSLPPVKLHCSLLAEEAVKGALKQYRSRKKTRITDTDESAEPEAAEVPAERQGGQFAAAV